MSAPHPRYKYLTRNYVEWLGLKEVWMQRLGLGGYVPEDGCKPMTPYELAVEFEGRSYIKSDDGLSYDLI